MTNDGLLYSRYLTTYQLLALFSTIVQSSVDLSWIASQYYWYLWTTCRNRRQTGIRTTMQRRRSNDRATTQLCRLADLGVYLHSFLFTFLVGSSRVIAFGLVYLYRHVNTFTTFRLQIGISWAQNDVDMECRCCNEHFISYVYICKNWVFPCLNCLRAIGHVARSVRNQHVVADSSTRGYRGILKKKNHFRRIIADDLDPIDCAWNAIKPHEFQIEYTGKPIIIHK